MPEADDDNGGAPRYTADHGRIVVEEELGGLLWRGHQRAPRERQLVVAVKQLAAVSGKAMLESAHRYEVPGIAPLAYLGFADAAAASPILLAEARPDGIPLAGVVEETGLTEEEVVRVGLALCDTTLAWIAQRGHATVGFRPETVYVTGDLPGERTYAGATPRVFAMIGNAGHDGTFPPPYYGAPLAESATRTSAHDMTFVIGLVLWFAANGDHAYPHINYIERPRPPFTGPAALAPILDDALRLYDEERLTVADLRAQLATRARTLNVEAAPFPPPGLAD
jgi:hypothetical protein